MTKPAVIMYDSPEAAQLVTRTGWQDRHGHFYGDNESAARYNGSTHKLCECCSAVMETRGWCSPCHDRAKREKWLAMPLVEWDGTGMFCVFDDDRYFSSTEEFYEWCADEALKPDDVMLVTCGASGLSEIDADHWADDLAEDCDPPHEVLEALKVLNKAIRDAKPQTYWPAAKRMILKSEVVSSEDADVEP